MHIARVRHLFYPDTPCDYFFELSMQQVKMGHEVDVLTWNRNKRLSEENVADGFTIYRLPGFNFSVDGTITEYPYLPSLPQKIEKLKPEIVHAESHLFLTTVQAVKEAKKLGIPCVVTVHGVMAKRSAVVNLAQYAYLKTFGLWVFKNVDRIICLTKSDAQEVVKLGCSPKKIRVIPNAVDTNRFRPGTKHKENLVVWTGRFVPEKGLNYLIKAARIIEKKFKDVKFMLVGYGPLKRKIMELTCNYGLLNKVVYVMGPFNRNQVADILGKSSIFVLPSLKEGLPLSLLEAMACGKPVVGSNVPGISDILTHRHNGLLIQPKNPEALANAILTLLNNKYLRKKLGQNARQLIIEKYSLNIITKKMEKIYYEAIEEAKSL